METEYRAYIQDTGDALLAIEAALSGSTWIPRVTRRWNHYERIKRIRSGTVFVFNARESNVKRWTDGRMWTPSRILKNFLVYRERYSHEEVHVRVGEGARYPTWLVGACDGPEVRQDGLIKKTISIVVDGVRYSLVSYYHPNDVLSGALVRPCHFPPLNRLRIRASILACKGIREKARIVTGADGVRRPVMEQDEVPRKEFPAEPCYQSDDSTDDSDSDSNWTVPGLLASSPETTESQQSAPDAPTHTRPVIDDISHAFQRAAHLRSPVQLRRPRPRVRFEPYWPQEETQSLPPSPTHAYTSFPTYPAHAPLTRSFSEPSFLTLHQQPPAPEPEFTFVKEELDYHEDKHEQVFLSDSMSAITPEMPRLDPPAYSPPGYAYAGSDAITPPPAEFLPSYGCWLSPTMETLDKAEPLVQFHNYSYTLGSALDSHGWDFGDHMHDPFFGLAPLA